MNIVNKILVYSLCVMVMCAFSPVFSFASDASDINTNSNTQDKASVISESSTSDSTIINSELSEDDTGIQCLGSSSYYAKFCAYYDQAASWDIFVTINNIRNEKGLSTLVWDDNVEDYMLGRAVELAILYSFTRPNGEPGEEWYHGYKEGSVIEYVTDGLYGMDATEPIWNSDLHICVPAVVTIDGVSYFAVGIDSDSAGGNNSPYYESDEYIFDVSVKDGYLKTKAYFITTNGKIVKPIPTTKGKTYVYGLSNTNRNIEASSINTVFFDQVYSRSSNTRVATIDKYGLVKTKGVGVAKLTIKPASASSISHSQTVVVKPGKVTGVKLSTPKKKTIKVTWSKITGASGYQIYRSTKKGSGYKLVKTITKGSTRTWTNTKLKKNKKYYYKVRAYVKSGSKKYVGSYSSIVSKKTKK